MAKDLRKHNVSYYFRIIMQRPAKQLNGRWPNMWNAYLHKELKIRNDDLPDGAKKYQCADIVDELSEKWNKMSQAEKKEATKESVKELLEMREEKSFGAHSANIAASHDARFTVTTLEHECDKLRDQTKTQTLVIAVPSEPDVWFMPTVYVSCPGVLEFVQTLTKEPPERFAARMAAYLSSGVADEVARIPVPKIKYKNFAKNVTLPYHLQIKNYPPGIKFCAPSYLSELAEIELITHAWESGTTYWYYLNGKEYDIWLHDYNAGRLAGMMHDECDNNEDVKSMNPAVPNAATTSTSTSSSPHAVMAADSLPAADSSPAANSSPTISTSPATASISAITPPAVTPTPTMSAAASGEGIISPPTTTMDLTAAVVPDTVSWPTMQSSANKCQHPGDSAAPKAKKAKAPLSSFINHGCVVDGNGHPVPIEETTRRPRKKETAPRKRAQKKRGENTPSQATAAVTPGPLALSTDPHPINS
ncbi:hypothetical protein DAEQUDRAFT_805246 [Daedalea quercina L-15889]|uniref:Uncharacterized protein n=1 Tax=Daedalea quercina L-15889 TaxID=1314783 RepID=A0A165LNP8_9APHY|nr:hypothetical protein DAEQUDRAFT_805246 [Daedalea quercina L-15889]